MTAFFHFSLAKEEGRREILYKPGYFYINKVKLKLALDTFLQNCKNLLKLTGSTLRCHKSVAGTN